MIRPKGVWAGVLAACIFAALLIGFIFYIGGTRKLDLLAYDYYFLLRGSRSGSEKIVMIDIDEATLRSVGRFPIPRTKYTDLIKLLSKPESRAAAIGFDIFLIERDPLPRVDAELGAAARRHGHVYFPAVFAGPFSVGKTRMSAEIQARQGLVEKVYQCLAADPGLADRFRSDPGQLLDELFAGEDFVGVDRLDTLALRLLNEMDLENSRDIVRATIGGLSGREAFISGEFDNDFHGTSKAQLDWMKRDSLAMKNTEILWNTIFKPARVAEPGISFLEACSAKGIAYQKLLSGPAGQGQDLLLRDRVAGVKGVGLESMGAELLTSFKGQLPDGFPVLPVTDSVRSLVNVQPYINDREGVLRSFPLVLSCGERVYPSMGLALVLDLLGSDLSLCSIKDNYFVIGSLEKTAIRFPVDEAGRVMLGWNGAWGKSFRHISLASLLPEKGSEQKVIDRAREAAGQLKGKIVFVGLTAAGTHDLNPIPFDPRYPMVGANATVADGILRGTFPRKVARFNVLLLILLCAFLGALCGGVFSKIAAIILGFSAGIAVFFGSYGLFVGQGIFVPPVAPLFSFGLSGVFSLFWRLLVVEREGRKLQEVFAFRTSKEMVTEMLRNPEVVKLGGKRVEATVFFADLQGFTSVAEGTEPEDLITLLNAYLTVISDTVLECGGYLDKYEGDAVMAIFGVPVDCPDHAVLACRAALLTQERLGSLQERMARSGRPVFKCRIGLASGGVVAGNIGSPSRADYTVLGDKVNLASRLEGANRFYGSRILVSDATRLEAGEGDFVFREIDLVRVVGRKESTRIFELFAMNQGVTEALLSGLAEFSKALELFRNRCFSQAATGFSRCNELLGGNDGPAILFLERCREMQQRAPEADWDAVNELKGK
jgi:adenylate cyclase